jgi:hypothetical protein
VTLNDLRVFRREEIIRLAASYGAHNVRVFGSVARGQSSPASDVDFPVDLDSDRTSMNLGGLLTELEQVLQVRVAVATGKMLRTPVREQALREAVAL